MPFTTNSCNSRVSVHKLEKILDIQVVIFWELEQYMRYVAFVSLLILTFLFVHRHQLTFWLWSTKWGIWLLAVIENFTWNITAYIWDLLPPTICHLQLHRIPNEGGKVRDQFSCFTLAFFCSKCPTHLLLIFHHHGRHEWQSPCQSCSMQHN